MTPTQFHAHIYYDESSQEARASASRLRDKLIELQTSDVYVGNLIDRKVGPHMTAMFEIGFSIDHFANFVPWLMVNHGIDSVLIHPLTGDEIKDHFVHALWLGEVLPLDRTKLID